MSTQTQSTIDATTMRQIVENTAQTICDHYVFPDAADAMRDALIAALEAGDYGDLLTPDALCERLTADLQAVSHDRHIRVRYNQDPRPVGLPEGGDSPEDLAEWTALARSVNFGFYKVERLDGNIGYLDLRNFWDASLPGAGEAAVAAMTLLAPTDALIIDLRKNGGGSPSMVALLISFLVAADPIHLNNFHDRSSAVARQSWTLPYVPAPRTPDKPVYVLTSKRTFSGAEEFAYNLKQMKRATLIGEFTGGGAHPGQDISVTPHFRVFVPMGRPTNAISGTNWEGVGVEPDVPVTQEAALDTAYRLALQTVLAKLANPTTEAARDQAAEARAALERLEA